MSTKKGELVDQEVVDEELGDEERQGREPSKVAQEIERLRSATVRAASDRERLPQPLFWSLFQNELKELKKKKEIRRALQEILG